MTCVSSPAREYSPLKGCFAKFPCTDILQPVKGAREFHPFLSYACSAVQRVLLNTQFENSALLDVKKHTFLIPFVPLSRHMSSARYHQHVFPFVAALLLRILPIIGNDVVLDITL